MAIRTATRRMIRPPELRADIGMTIIFKPRSFDVFLSFYVFQMCLAIETLLMTILVMTKVFT